MSGIDTAVEGLALETFVFYPWSSTDSWRVYRNMSGKGANDLPGRFIPARELLAHGVASMELLGPGDVLRP